MGESPWLIVDRRSVSIGKFFLEVQFLRQGVSVEIDGWMLEPLGSPRVPETVGASIR